MANLRQAATERGKQVGDVLITDQGPVAGTLEYMSPEQATGAPARVVDGRSDIYSVGVLMFEALTGGLPLASEDPIGLLSQKQAAATNGLLCATVLKALQRDPDYRFQSAAEMVEALGEISHSLGKPSSVHVKAATGSESVGTSFSFPSSELVIDDALDQPPKIASGQKAEAAARWNPGRDFKPPVKHELSEAAASTDRTIEEIRTAWLQTAGQVPARPPARSSQVRMGLVVVGFALIGVLAFWMTYHGQGQKMTPQPRGTGGAGTMASPYVSAPDSESDPGSNVTPMPLVVPSPDTQQPTLVKEISTPPLPGASSAAKAPLTQRAEGGPLDQRRGLSTAAIRSGDRRSGAVTGLAVSVAADSRDAEIKKRIAMGWLLVERGNQRAAIESFSEALKLDPSNVEAQAALRVARFANQNPEVKVLPSQSPADGIDTKKGQP
ncbi:MAG: hypothetical protein HY508_10625 [Acidobacteria bacterium]|nr:hypothetical protein [Acidobacteriota bacterium]